jgi:hypothetical protein
MDLPLKRRFIDEDPELLVKSKFSKKTEYATLYSVRLFSQFLDRRNLDILNMEASSLDEQLAHFYASLRKEDGTEMSSSSLANVRYGLSRHLKSLRDVDIIKDSKFTHSNEVFSGKLSKLKREGKGVVTHYSVISDEDLLKIASLIPNTPERLQLKVWFTLQLHFAQRGAENIHSMEKTDLIFKLSHDGKKEIHVRDYLTKNHRESDTSKSTSAFITEVENENCPVKLVESYLSQLHPDNKFLWQKPYRSVNNKSCKWFQNMKVGVNTISQMMHKLCKVCNITVPYTNHCVRATAITILGQDFGDNDVRAISGHKSLNALGIYKRTSNKTLQSMSNHLHNHLYASTSTSTAITTDIADMPFLEHHAISELDGYPNAHSTPIQRDCTTTESLDRGCKSCVPSTSTAITTDVSDVPLLEYPDLSELEAYLNVPSTPIHDRCCISYGVSHNVQYENLVKEVTKTSEKVVILNNCSGITFNM